MPISSPNSGSTNTTEHVSDPDKKYMLEERLTTVSSRGMSGQVVAEAPVKEEKNTGFSLKRIFTWIRNIFRKNP